MRDIFTYTASDFRWINHEWLHDVWLYVATRYAGYGWTAGLFALIWTAAIGVVTRWRISWLVASLALTALLPYLGVRPIAWTVLLLGVVLELLRRKCWWGLALVFALWANLHGGFVMGLVVVAVYAMVQRSLGAVGWLGGFVLVTLVNPYGWEVYVEIARTIGDQALRSMIVEWRPLAITYANAPYLMAAVMAVWLVKGWPWWRRVLGGLLLIMTIGATRQLPLLVVATVEVVQLGYIMAGRWLLEQRLLGRWWSVGLSGGGLIIASVAVVAPPIEAGESVMVRPYRSVQMLRERPCEGRIFNHYSFGGYLIAWLPGVPVYIDGRMPSWSGPEGRYLDRWLRVMKEPKYAEREFTRYNVKCVLITRQDVTLQAYLRRSGWQRVMVEEMGVLWRRD